MGVIALDSNIFIRALGDRGPLGKKAIQLLEDIKQTTTKVFVSVMVLEEFFVRVFKEKKEKNLAYILNFITLDGLVQLVDVNQQIALLAAEIRAKYHIKAPDAIHLASAIISKADTFITTDRKIPRKVEGLKVVVIA